MDISIIICTYNRCDLLKNVLNSIVDLRVPEGLNWEVLIIDNASTDNTKEAIEEFRGRSTFEFRYIYEGIKSKSVCLNRAIDEAKGDILVFIDSDMTMDKDYLNAVLQAVKKYPDVNVFGGRIVVNWSSKKPGWIEAEGRYSGNIRSILGIDGGEVDRDFNELGGTPSIGNAFLKHKILNKDTYFRKDLGPRNGRMGYGEDAEFFSRLKGFGEKIFYIKDALTLHNIETHKLSKKYFCTRQFEMGIYDVKYQKISQNTVYYFGIPRFLFRRVVTLFFLWVISLNAQKKFFYKLRLNYVLGQIKGYLAIRRSMPCQK